MILTSMCGKNVIVDDNFPLNIIIGKIYISPRGYAYSEIKGKNHLTSIHSIVCGSRPGFDVDHIDGDKLNNKRSNLRLITHRDNCLNRLVKGSQIQKIRGKIYYRVRVAVNCVKTHVGYYKTKQEAVDAYNDFYISRGYKIYPKTIQV